MWKGANVQNILKADKLSKTEQGKYSAKYALPELLVCGECGEHYRRVTWTHKPTTYAAKGFKEIKWRCISRIQYGKKKCHNSPTVDEQALHQAIVSTINEFCDVKDDITKVLRESISEVLDPNMNGSVLAAQMYAVLERLKQEDFKLTEYDDIAVRQIIEKVTVNDKVTITVTFKGGFEIRKML